MRGGAIPLLAWGALLIVMAVINWIWTADAIQVGTFAFAAGVVLAAGGLLALVSGATAVRRGSPETSLEPEAVPSASLGAVLAGLSVAMILFGFAFGRFPIYFGAAMLLASLGRIAIEIHRQRRSRDRAARRDAVVRVPSLPQLLVEHWQPNWALDVQAAVYLALYLSGVARTQWSLATAQDALVRGGSRVRADRSAIGHRQLR